MVSRDDPDWVIFFNTIEEIAGTRIEEMVASGLDPEVAFFRLTSELTELIGRAGIPVTLDADGYLPAAHRLSVKQVHGLFGRSSRRTKLSDSLERVVDLAHHVKAQRLLVDGSFVSSKPEPADIDIALLSPGIVELRRQGNEAATELFRISENFDHDYGVGLYLTQTELDWWSWWRLFSQVKEPFSNRRYKGLIEVHL